MSRLPVTDYFQVFKTIESAMKNFKAVTQTEQGWTFFICLRVFKIKPPTRKIYQNSVRLFKAFKIIKEVIKIFKSLERAHQTEQNSAFLIKNSKTLTDCSIVFETIKSLIRFSTVCKSEPYRVKLNFFIHQSAFKMS